ncbi:uncharacterized protein LOC128989752 [Macrosteles quadrilineatus]|uniref:uncharacterized protein LOC128989752 n=1 Tax=Macrosteles quadrilineatus TaxID=74068 RepID=UPI0023E1E130|nr:uncharacterized protein LOC128989752 [Macrosteles quadrilineatus]
MSSSVNTKKGCKTKKDVNVKIKNKLQNKPSLLKEDKKCKENEVKENHVIRVNIEDSGSGTDLSSPGLCSALQLANEIQAASAGTSGVQELKIFQQKQLDKAIKQKAVKKTNVPFTQHIFKNLVDLHISDNDVAANKTPHKNVNFSTNKDPVFHLEDFYKPDFSTKVSVKVPNQKFQIDKIDYYNGFELYERLESVKKLQGNS